MSMDDLNKLIEGGAETPNIDFKGTCPWDARSFAKDVLAMSNIADGGRLIIGIAEKPKGVFNREGVTVEDKKTYQIDVMRDQLTKYTDPFVEIAVYFVKDTADGKDYVIIRVEPFKEVPIICKCNDQMVGLTAGGIYYRNRNRRIESALVSNSYDMRDVIERAMLKMRYRALRIGYQLPPINDSDVVQSALDKQMAHLKGLQRERADL